MLCNVQEPLTPLARKILRNENQWKRSLVQRHECAIANLEHRNMMSNLENYLDRIHSLVVCIKLKVLYIYYAVRGFSCWKTRVLAKARDKQRIQRREIGFHQGAKWDWIHNKNMFFPLLNIIFINLIRSLNFHGLTHFWRKVRSNTKLPR